MSAAEWPGVWPALVMVGAWVMVATGVIAIAGGVAGIVGNERLAELLTVKISAPPFVLGTAAFFLGFGGLWTILIVGIVLAFAWLVRSPTHLKAGTEDDIAALENETLAALTQDDRAWLAEMGWKDPRRGLRYPMSS